MRSTNAILSKRSALERQLILYVKTPNGQKKKLHFTSDLGSEYNKQHYVYNDNVTYRQLTNSLWRIERIENAEGYIGYNIQQNSYLPYYYIKDYLGNVRETYMGSTNATSFTRVQQMQYYPSGLPWNDNYKASQQPYKYGSKEFVEMHGLDEYDSQARWYYPALMRTTTQDPLAEKYYDISPYAWCANNPVNLVDPDGKDVFFINSRGRIIKTEEDKDQDKIYLPKYENDNYVYREEKSISFEYGTIQEYECFNASNKQTTWFKVNNQQNAIDLFKFFADNLEIEFLLTFTEKTNYISTTHESHKSNHSHIVDKILEKIKRR